MLKRLLGTLLCGICSLFIFNAAVFAQPPANTANNANGDSVRQLTQSLVRSNFNLEKYGDLLQRINDALKNKRFSDYELSFYRNQLLLIQDKLQTLTAKAQDSVDQQRKLLYILEAKSLKYKQLDIEKDKFLIEQIKKHKLLIEVAQAQLLRLEYFRARINDMVKHIQALRVNARKNLAFKRNQILFLPKTWQEITSDFKGLGVDTDKLARNFVSGGNTLIAVIFYVVLLIVFFGYLFFIKKWLRRHFTGEIDVERRFNVFNIHFCLRALIPGIIFYIIGSYIQNIIGGYGSLAIWRDSFRATGVLIIALGMIHVIYEIYRPVSPQAVSKNLLRSIAVMLAIFVFINSANVFAFYSLTYIRLNPDMVAIFDLIWSVVFIIFMAKVLFSAKPSRSTQLYQKHVIARFCINYYVAIRFILMAVLVIYPILLIFGYVNFANNLIVNVLQTIIAFTLFDWVHSMSKFYFPKMNLTVQKYYYTRFKAGERAMADATPEEKNKLFNYWLVTTFDVVLILALVIVLILSWGLHPEILANWFNVIMYQGISFGKNGSFSLSHLIKSLLVFAIIFYLTRVVQKILDQRVLNYLRIDYGTKHAIKTTVGYIGLGAAIVLFVYSLGINLTTLTFIISGLSVGIGIGLQDFFKNFFAGFILLIERPVKVGDMVIVNNDYGIIKKIRLRATEIETFNNTTFIIPNSDFVIKPISNETINPISRSIIDIGISYNCDPKQARDLLIEVAKQHPKVLANPECSVIFKDFADSSLLLQLRIFTMTGDRADAVSDLRFAILEAFNKAGIEIPYPQQDIYVKEFKDLTTHDIKRIEPKNPPLAEPSN